MMALAIAPFPDFRLSAIEVDSHEKRYTVDTIAQMREASPDAQFVFIMGTDMYRDFETWKDYKRLFTLTHIAVVNRPGFEFRTGLTAHQVVEFGRPVTLPAAPAVFYLPFVDQPISSSALRDALRHSQDVRQLLPEAVHNYIRIHNLYS
jgi:nicotinate-nucleotide adenylyltransferase